MPRKPKKEQVACTFFRWLLGKRHGVYYADGRSCNSHDAGRHSLGTRDRREALGRLRRLDLVKAVEFGLAKEDLLANRQDSLMPLDEGRERYLQFVSRPPVQGGAAPATVKRYRAILDKFVSFAKSEGSRCWQQVTKALLTRYGSWLEDRDYHPRTQYTELTVLKQVLKWLAAEGLLPAAGVPSVKLVKPRGTTTYCYTRRQVGAIVTFCRGRSDLAWLADVVVALATTGLRIGELAGLRWSDVDLGRGVLRLEDTSRRVKKSRRQEARATKSHRDRALPLHEELRRILERLPRAADGRVFHGPRGGRLKPDTVRNVLKREVLPALAKEFPPDGDDPGVKAGRLHGFRHYFCSVSADSGVPEQMLMAWLGHRDSEMIRHYYHLRQEEARAHMARVPFLSEPPDRRGGAEGDGRMAQEEKAKSGGTTGRKSVRFSPGSPGGDGR
jgi:integrase